MNPKTLNVVFMAVIVVLVGVIIYFAVGNKIQLPTNLPYGNNGSRICAQVITNAKNPATGECKEFPTPCDVPSGWAVGCGGAGINPGGPVQGLTSTKAVVYENQYMKITVPAGWTRTITTPGAVNIAKDNYILSINPNAMQASGIIGGRFGEISQGAPSADAVVKDFAQGECSAPSNIYSNLYGHYYRKDYYVNKNDPEVIAMSNVVNSNGPLCIAPADGSTAWFFS